MVTHIMKHPVHIDRVRKVRKQNLPRETEAVAVSEPEAIQVDSNKVPAEADAESEDSPNEEPFVETRFKRVVRKPRWMRDCISVLSVCRDMPNTKKTPRKMAACPNCKKDIQLEDYIKHVQQCRQTETTTVITCNVCKTPFSKLAYMRRHKDKP